MSEAAVDLSLIARQKRQIVSDMSSLKDDMGLMMAILMRLDGTVVRLVNEVRAQHAQHIWSASRVRALEIAGEGEPV